MPPDSSFLFFNLLQISSAEKKYAGKNVEIMHPLLLKFLTTPLGLGYFVLFYTEWFGRKIIGTKTTSASWISTCHRPHIALTAYVREFNYCKSYYFIQDHVLSSLLRNVTRLERKKRKKKLRKGGF